MKNEKGFTLIEVVVSILIFGLVMVLFVSMYNTIYKIQKRSNDITYINNVAAKKIAKQQGGSAGDLVIDFSGIGLTTTISGTYYSGDESDDTYRFFKPTGWSR